MFRITSIYLVINAIIFVVLSILVVRLRMRHSISLGEGNNEHLRKAARAFGNNEEYLPVVILLLAALESLQANTILLHVMGISFTVGRISHALAIYQKIPNQGRIFGMIMTYSVILTASVYLVYLNFR